MFCLFFNNMTAYNPQVVNNFQFCIHDQLLYVQALYFVATWRSVCPYCLRCFIISLPVYTRETLTINSEAPTFLFCKNWVTIAYSNLTYTKHNQTRHVSKWVILLKSMATWHSDVHFGLDSSYDLSYQNIKNRVSLSDLLKIIIINEDKTKVN